MVTIENDSSSSDSIQDEYYSDENFDEWDEEGKDDNPDCLSRVSLHEFDGKSSEKLTLIYLKDSVEHVTCWRDHREGDVELK